MNTFEDERGKIIDLDSGYSVIESKAGSTRAKHWHRRGGSHVCVLTKGSLEYYERDVGNSGKPSKQVFKAPAAFYTGPRLEHEMFFIEDSEMVCVRDTRQMSQEEYEADIVKFKYSLKEEYDRL